MAPSTLCAGTRTGTEATLLLHLLLDTYPTSIKIYPKPTQYSWFLPVSDLPYTRVFLVNVLPMLYFHLYALKFWIFSSQQKLEVPTTYNNKQFFALKDFSFPFCFSFALLFSRCVNLSDIDFVRFSPSTISIHWSKAHNSRSLVAKTLNHNSLYKNRSLNFSSSSLLKVSLS